MTDIRVENIGPVVEFRYTLEEPGLHVLKGRQQSGKTTIQRAVQWNVDGHTDQMPTKRDGAKNGSVRVGKRTLSITRKVVEDGELGLEGLGPLDISVLHQPKFKESHTRDKYRIATLCRLGGAEASEDLFHSLLGGREMYEKVLGRVTEVGDDLVDMAEKVKRAIEVVARERELRLEKLNAAADAIRLQTRGIDQSAPHDENELAAEAQRAASRKATLAAQRVAADNTLRRAAGARESLAGLQSVTAVEDAQAALDALVQAETTARVEVTRLQTELARAQYSAQVAEERTAAAKKVLAAAEREQSIAATWRADIAAAEAITRPTDEEIAEAENAVTEALKAMEYGRAVRLARTAEEQIDTIAAEAKAVARKGENLRLASRSVYDILSDAIANLPNCPLRIWHDDSGKTRLVLTTERSHDEPFDELSDGAKWTVIIGMLCDRPGKLVVLPQSAFGEISPANRAMIHNLFRERGCYLLTAQVDDGDLRAEIYRPELAA